MVMPDENIQLNPQITSMLIGARNLREITIYPLTVGPQLAIIQQVAEVGGAIQGAIDDYTTTGSVIGLVTKHLPSIIEHLIDPEEDKEKVLNDLTFDQFEKLAEMVYKIDFESLGKKAVGLFLKAMKAANELPEETE